MIGICRGAQLLNVVAGGRLFQHIEGHPSIHDVRLRDGRTVMSNSVHHQMMIPGPNAVIMATSNHAHTRLSAIEEPEDTPEVEAIFYPELGFYGIQGHPEFGHGATTRWFFEQVEECFFEGAR